MAYEGFPLRTPTAIRLLNLRADTNHNLNKKDFTLHVVDLSDNPPEYVALSYACGEPRDEVEIRLTPGARCLGDEDSTTVHVNGTAIGVAPNLSHALTRLIQIPSVDLIWIDAICINARDLAERSSQVQLMRHIYGNATQVLVWLGDDFRGEAAQTFKLLSQLALPDEDRSQEEVAEGSAVIGSAAMGWYPLDRWMALLLLLRRCWFTRQWCVQEVLLARSDSATLVLCGRETISWTDVISVCVPLLRHDIEPALNALLNNQIKKSGIEGSDSVETRPTQHLLSFLNVVLLLDQGMHLSESKSISFTGVPVNELSSYSLLCVLCYFTKEKLTSDPRDAIYALLGLLQKICLVHGVRWEQIVPDYSRSPEETMQDVSARIIMESKWLGLLSIASGLFAPQGTSLPSWSIAWLQRRSNPLTILDSFSFDASDTRSRGSFPKKIVRSSLNLSGLRVGTLHTSVSPFDGVSILKICSEMVGYPSTGESKAKVLRTTLVADSIRFGTQEAVEDVEDFRLFLTTYFISQFVTEARDAIHEFGVIETLIQCSRLFDELKSCEPGHGYPSTPELQKLYEQKVALGSTGYNHPAPTDCHYSDWWKNAIFRVLPGRHLFLTEDKHLLGLCPKESQPGDEVYILQGGLTPFILRPVTQAACKKTFQLVGEAYVHGYMYGKAMSRESEFEEVTLV